MPTLPPLTTLRLSLLLSALGAALAARAGTVTTYASRVDWLGAVSGATVNTEQFTAAAGPQFDGFKATSTPLFGPSLSIYAPHGELSVSGGWLNLAPYAYGSRYSGNSYANTLLSFDGGARGLAMDYLASYYTNTGSEHAKLVVVLADGSAAATIDLRPAAGYPATGFFGFTSDVPVMGLVVAADGWEGGMSTPNDFSYPKVNVDNVSTARFAPVPEPSALAALGLGALTLLRHRRR